MVDLSASFDAMLTSFLQEDMVNHDDDLDREFKKLVEEKTYIMRLSFQGKPWPAAKLNNETKKKRKSTAAANDASCNSRKTKGRRNKYPTTRLDRL